MSRSLTIVFTWLVLSLHAAGAATSATTTDALDAGLAEETRPGGPVAPPPAEPVTSIRVVAPPPAPERPLSANPLWAIPLTRLPITRNRPIFSPSRRPPPVIASEPAPVQAPPPPREKQVEPPPLSLVGTIASGEESFGIFLDHSSKQALRLKIGEEYQGWKLRTIQGRQVTMETDQQGAVLILPPPGEQSSGEVRLVPVSSNTTPSSVARRRP